jgi:hypothetical protein
VGLVRPLAGSAFQGLDDMGKLSEAELAKLIGKRTPRRGEGQPPGPNWTPKSEEKTPSSSSPEPVNFFNPKAVTERRLRDAEKGMKCGGKVKKMAGGGAVRGSGCASKGTGFKGTY